MSSGYAYGEQEPKERCPYCKALCCADFVDVGVGYVQCGPFHCEGCGASEIGPNNDGPLDQLGDGRDLSQPEIDCGWYAPGSRPDALANTDEDGRIIRYFEADTLYRERCGVAPRYDRHGRLIAS